jgi:L-asparaginase
MQSKIRIAHLAGPNAAIQNTPALVTSNKARRKYGLPLLTDIEGRPSKFDVLRPQKLAAPVTVYVEQFSAHPLEVDAQGLYGPPDGYLGSDGKLSPSRRSESDRPVYEIELLPDDGYYPLPYMAQKKGGGAWETDGVTPAASREDSRQPFMPDGVRTFAEIDQLGIGPDGVGNMISNRAEVDYYRVAPSGGYMSRGEEPGKDFFPYRPFNLSVSPPRMSLAHIANATQRILSGGRYAGAIWTQGSPRIEETLYWLNLFTGSSTSLIWAAGCVIMD